MATVPTLTNALLTLENRVATLTLNLTICATH